MTKEPNAPRLSIVLALFFVSGLAALIYQVLWIKELSLLFGNSAQATAATLTAFFTGIAAGNAYWGRRASTLTRPLLSYGVLELCVTFSAILYFVVYFAYDSVYPVLFSVFENAPLIFALAKFALALLLFFPAAFFMGGTLPVMTQYLVRNRETLGKRASTLYAINTFGAASGAIAAGFYLPRALGIDVSYFLAMTATLLVGIVAIVLGRNTTMQETESHLTDSKNNNKINKKDQNGRDMISSQMLSVLALLSGFASLALQVLWVRMFAQVLHNSVYSYSAILSVFLIALALGGAITRQLASRQIDVNWFLPVLLSLAALLVGASPVLFHFLTNGIAYFGSDESFIEYLLQIFLLTATVIGPPTIVIGILLPYLFRLAENSHRGPGETVGRLVTINTIGAIIGSFAAGFIMLGWLGLWSSLQAIALLYVFAAFWFLIVRQVPSLSKNTSKKAISKDSVFKNIAAKVMPIGVIPITVILILFTILSTSQLQVVRIAANKNETLLKVWEGADATVAVVRRDGHLRTKLNNWYALGGTGAMTSQQMQTQLPLFLHSDPKSLFYLGLGTGITAGTALKYKVDEVVVAEISPSAISASEEFFTDYTNNLFDDPRVSVIAEDGRNVLRGSKNTYDLIISDLFIPWKAGAGNLYAVEHYEVALKRLNIGGMYAQWLPLYQLTEEEFVIIARTMQEVFPMVSMWRGNFSGKSPVLALIGHREHSVLSPNAPVVRASKRALSGHLNKRSSKVPLMSHYVGTLRADDTRLSSAPLNTDSHRQIEYLAPINHRREKAGKVDWFTGQPMLDFINSYLSEEALSADPYLLNIDSAWHEVVRTGYLLQSSLVARDQGQGGFEEAVRAYRSTFKKAAKELK